MFSDGDPSVTNGFKMYNCLQTALNVTMFSGLIFLSMKLLLLSFRYIDILGSRYQINTSRGKLILSAIYVPLMLGFAISIFLEIVWIYRMFSGTNCSTSYSYLTSLNYYNICWSSQGLSQIVIWIIWCLASEMNDKLMEDNEAAFDNSCNREDDSKCVIGNS